MIYLIPPPALQIDFAAALSDIRNRCLQDALMRTVKSLDIARIDGQLSDLVAKTDLASLAGHGLRGELMFPIPILLSANPYLLGYYRLLYGYSQKVFYTSTTGASRFKSMEESGVLTKKNAEELPVFCKALIEAGTDLLAGIGTVRISRHFLDDLTLLTLGPQLRGGANNQRGATGTKQVFDAIRKIVEPALVTEKPKLIVLENAAGRTVRIEFALDPDIIIREQMDSGEFRELIAVEIKAGADFSNIHNRIGEAEKSHQKAKNAGYNECWTVVNVDKINIQTAHKESPSTSRFYRISDILKECGPEYEDFRNRVISLTGISV